ncbi:MAG TPA: hypothetical protein VGN15_03880, partial [Ktedonobacteraceae bacterium]|nr:hypothetical protein [Ktedonobacteraceae bacterium]
KTLILDGAKLFFAAIKNICLGCCCTFLHDRPFSFPMAMMKFVGRNDGYERIHVDNTVIGRADKSAMAAINRALQ